MIDPMSPKPLPLPLPGSFAASLASSLSLFAARLSLQSDLCPDQALVWHAAQQYATSAQPEHVLNVTPFLGLCLHSPHTVKSGNSCCIDDMTLLCFVRGEGNSQLFFFVFFFLPAPPLCLAVFLSASLHTHS